jgi:hypothetical protein
MGLLEAMACGLKPVIHNFPGADQIFPSEFLYNIAEEFCRHILSEQYEPQTYRRFVEENYARKNQLSKINNIFTRLEADIDAQQSGTSEYDNLQKPNPQIVELSTESSPSALENNLIV